MSNAANQVFYELRLRLDGGTEMHDMHDLRDLHDGAGLMVHCTAIIRLASGLWPLASGLWLPSSVTVICSSSGHVGESSHSFSSVK
jgi:hypothetical protein